MGNNPEKVGVPLAGESEDLSLLLPEYDFIGPKTLRSGGASPFDNIVMYGLSGAGKGHISNQMLQRYGVRIPGFGNFMRKVKEIDANTFSNDADLPDTVSAANALLIKGQNGAPLLWEGHLCLYPADRNPVLVTLPLDVLKPKAIVFVLRDPAQIFNGQVARFEGFDAQPMKNGFWDAPSAGRHLQHSSIEEIEARQKAQLDAASIIANKTNTPLYIVQNSGDSSIDAAARLYDIIGTYLPGLCKKV